MIKKGKFSPKYTFLNKCNCRKCNTDDQIDDSAEFNEPKFGASKEPSNINKDNKLNKSLTVSTNRAKSIY